MTEITSKDLELKRNNHHVWAYYMKQWSPTRNNNVYFTTKKKKIAFDSVRMIAVEEDFYQVKPLTQEHINVIKGISLLSPKALHEQHMSYLSDFCLMQNLEAYYKKSGIKDDKAEKILSSWKSNTIENYHSAHEREVSQILDELAHRNLSVLNDKNMVYFMQFLGQQDTRTKTFRETTIAAYHKPNSKTSKQVEKAVEECWWFLSYMYGMSMGYLLYLNRNNDTHCLLINDTNTPFITSDQPIVNVHQALTDEKRILKDHECDLFYPISPNVAYMINKSDRFTRGKVEISEDIVVEMNTKVAMYANIHLISSREESLKPYQKYIALRSGL